jgi:hypothetical protein
VILKRIHSKTEYRPFQLKALEDGLKQVQDFSFSHRKWLWTPFLGFFLLVQLTRRAIRDRAIPVLAITLPMVLQWLGIVALAPAGEYRYLLPFALLPLVLLPVWGSDPPLRTPGS